MLEKDNSYKNKSDIDYLEDKSDYNMDKIPKEVVKGTNEGAIKQKSEIESSVNGVVVREEDLGGIQFRWL